MWIIVIKSLLGILALINVAYLIRTLRRTRTSPAKSAISVADTVVMLPLPQPLTAAPQPKVVRLAEADEESFAKQQWWTERISAHPASSSDSQKTRRRLEMDQLLLGDVDARFRK